MEFCSDRVRHPVSHSAPATIPAGHGYCHTGHPLGRARAERRAFRPSHQGALTLPLHISKPPKRCPDPTGAAAPTSLILISSRMLYYPISLSLWPPHATRERHVFKTLKERHLLMLRWLKRKKLNTINMSLLKHVATILKEKDTSMKTQEATSSVIWITRDFNTHVCNPFSDMKEHNDNMYNVD